MVYVDSGSNDGSVELARSLDAEVVELDMSVPFSAARARNAGFQSLKKQHDTLQFVQFLDGDCLLNADWLPAAIAFIKTHPEYAVVCGRRRERYPDASIYNRLIDMEWNTPVGEAKACGGDALYRVSAFQQVGGFNPNVVAGEEPELCIRLRNQGYRLMRLDAEMTLHDASMTRFSQWWKRTQRAGYAYAYGAFLHGKPPEHHKVRELRSALIWGLGIPSVILLTSLLTRGWAGVLIAAFPIQAARIARHRSKQADSVSDACLYGLFCVLGKFPETLGILKFHWERWTGRQASIMEYK